MLRLVLIALFSPCLAALAAPVPKEPPQPTVAVLRQAIGKSHLGKEVRAIGRHLGEDPVIKYNAWSGDPKRDNGGEDTGFYLLWKSKGLDMAFENGKLKTIWLFNEGADEHKRYSGELPGGVSFDDDRVAVEKKLGKPDEVTELGVRKVLGKGPEIEEIWLDYTKGPSISMRRPANSEKWTVHYIAFHSVDEDRK